MLFRFLTFATLLVALPSGNTASLQDNDCRAEFAVLRPVYFETLWEGRAARDVLDSRFRGLIQKYSESDPACAVDLHEYLVMITIVNERFDEANRLISTVYEDYTEWVDEDMRSRLLTQRGYALERLGETRESSQAYFEAAALASRTRASQGVRSLMDAGFSAEMLHDYDAAESYLAAAIELSNDSLAPGPQRDENVGQALAIRASVVDARLSRELSSGGDVDSLTVRLLETADRALGTLPDTDGRNAGFRAYSLSRGALALALSGRTDEARRRADQAMPYARRATGYLPHAIYRTWAQRSRIEEALGDMDAAERAAQRARTEALRLQSGMFERTMVKRLAVLAERRQEWDAATRLYTEAIGREENHRERLGLQDWTAQGFTEVAQAYRGLARVQLAQGDYLSAFKTLDQTRARHLRDLRRHLEIRARLTPENRANADSVQRALESVRLEAVRGDLTASEQATVTQRISDLQERLEAITGPTVSEATPLDMDALRSALEPRGRVLISYFLDAEVSYAFVVRADTFLAVQLATSPSEIEDRLRQAGAPWASDRRADPAFDLSHLRAISEAVISPLAQWIPDGAPLVIVPDGPLGSVAFGMLPTESPTDYATASYLVRDHAISHELAASMLLEHDAPPEAEDLSDLVGFGRSDFESIGFTWNDSAALRDLPHVPDELRAISAGLRVHHVALNQAATESHLDEHIGRARVLHIASHATVDASAPLYSKIALWESESDDGVLHLYELQGRAMPADLVVLSGCSTARGSYQAGEGMIGLQYAVRSAGSESSLATLWAVDDEASVDVMGAFYQGLKDGLPKDEALQAAQVAYIETHDGLKASPFFWAAPVLSGRVDPVRLRSRTPVAPWVALAVGLLGLGVAWRLRQRRLDVQRL